MTDNTSMRCRSIVLFALVIVLAAISAWAQTNIVATIAPHDSGTPSSFHGPTNQEESVAQLIERNRAFCLQGRRSICGRILKVMPDGLLVQSGYTNLLRAPLNRSWLVPGTVSARLAPHLVERNEPDAVCTGMIFLADIPGTRLAKAKLYDYVIVKGYPDGNYTYASVGNIHHTVRRFSFSLEAAVNHRIEKEVKRRGLGQGAPPNNSASDSP